MIAAGSQLLEEGRPAVEALSTVDVLSKPCAPDELAASLLRSLSPRSCLIDEC
jgi:hypothetical protein